MVKRKPEVVSQKNEAGFVLLDMESGKFYSLYDVAADIWEYVEQELSQEKIINLLKERYGISEKKAFNDVNAFLDELRKEDLIT